MLAVITIPHIQSGSRSMPGIKLFGANIHILGKAKQMAYGDDKNFDYMVAIDKSQKAKGKMLGRYIQHQYADGYAYYKITKVNKATVRIEVQNVGDGWTLPAWGEKTSIPIDSARHFLYQRDSLDEFFSKHGNT